jgi:hypothetical protein
MSESGGDATTSRHPDLAPVTPIDGQPLSALELLQLLGPGTELRVERTLYGGGKVELQATWSTWGISEADARFLVAMVETFDEHAGRTTP